MRSEDKFFFEILTALHKSGALEELILIGGWCHRLYRHHFGNPAELTALRTADIDFLIPIPPKIKNEVDIPTLLESLGFDEAFSILSGYEKYVHPDLEIEFLVPETGRPKEKPYKVEALHVNAQRLRYLDILQSHTMSITFNGIKTAVPEPAAFVLNKFIVSERRDKPDKRENDLRVGKELGEYLIQDQKQRERLKQIYTSFHPRLKRKLLDLIGGVSGEIATVLI
jgi:hypothetical protein